MMFVEFEMKTLTFFSGKLLSIALENDSMLAVSEASRLIEDDEMLIKTPLIAKAENNDEVKKFAKSIKEGLKLLLLFFRTLMML